MIYRGLVLICLLGLAGPLPAQLAVQVQMPQETFLVYESLPVRVSIRNYSARTVQLENEGNEPWLRLTVAREDNSLVPARLALDTREPVLVPGGQAVSRTVDLLPLFEVRERGRYRVQAAVVDGGRVTTSTPVSFTVIRGRELWSQTVGLPEPAPATELRQYALLARREGNADYLFVSVREEPSGEQYSLIALGPMLPATTPSALIDREAVMHVLFQNGPRSYGYIAVDSQARVLRRAGYADQLSRPALAETNGVVTVVGGEQVYPRPERLLTDEELNPPPPPPPPPSKKKKWWWPFGGGGDRTRR